MVWDLQGRVRNEMDKDNVYRRIEGGTHGNAIGERLREEGYALGSSMIFSGEEARKAFQSVTAMGYTNRSDQNGQGTSRADALNYLYEGKKSRGQTVEEGISQLEVASKALSTSLGGLNDAMEAVSESAGKAGANTELARKQMLGYMNAGIQRGQGAGAVGFAQTISETNASYGRDYMSRVNSGGMYSRSMRYRAAALSGISAGALTNMERRDPTGAMGVYQKAANVGISGAGVTPAMQQWIKEKVAEAGGATTLRNNPDVADRIAQEFLDANPQIEPTAFPGVLGSLTGNDFGGDPVLAARWVVEQVGGNSMADTAKAHQMQVGKTDLSGKMMKGGGQNAGMDKSLDAFSKATTSGGFLGTAWGRDQSKATQDYMASARKSGQRDPIIEALLKNDALQGDSGDSTHVEVKTRSGRRVVTLAEAIKEFPNEVAAGQVTFVDGKAAGKDVASLTGGKVDLSRDYKSEASKDSKTGVAAKDWYAKHDNPVSGGGVIGLTPEASKLVTFLQSGGASAVAASNGTPPPVDNSGSPVYRGNAASWGLGGGGM